MVPNATLGKKKTAAFLEKYGLLLKIEKCEESTRINHPAAGERKVIRMICPPFSISQTSHEISARLLPGDRLNFSR